MNVHKNARLTFIRRLEMVQMITEGGLPPPHKGGASVFRERGAAGLPSCAHPIQRESLHPRRAPFQLRT